MIDTMERKTGWKGSFTLLNMHIEWTVDTALPITLNTDYDNDAFQLSILHNTFYTYVTRLH